MSRLFLYFLQFRQFRQFESYSRFFCRHFHNNYWVLYVSILYLLSLYNYRSLNTSTHCRLAHPYFLNSEFRNSILDGATFIRFIGSVILGSCSIGIFLYTAAAISYHLCRSRHLHTFQFSEAFILIIDCKAHILIVL